eukprot:g2811.t1
MSGTIGTFQHVPGGRGSVAVCEDATYVALQALLGGAVVSGQVRHRGNEGGGNASLFAKPLAAPPAAGGSGSEDSSLRDGDDVVAQARAALGSADGNDFSAAAKLTFADLEMWFQDEDHEGLLDEVMVLLNTAGENSGHGVFTFQRKTTADQVGGTPYDDGGNAEAGYAPCEFVLGVGVVTASSAVGWEQVVVWT